MSYDSLVIGSGAAGSILAWRLAAAGRRVLILERGPYVDSSEFTDNEIPQYLSLYNEGALQLTKDYGLQVFQGMCVGGSTTVNNGLCFEPPKDVLDEWVNHGIDLDGPRGLNESIHRVREMLDVTPIQRLTASKAALDFADAARRLVQQEHTGHVEVMSANFSDCVGCGYCNIGCHYGARISMVDRLLPWAQAEYDGHLDILADFEVEKVERKGKKAIGVSGTYLPSGKKLFIRAWQDVVIAAGAVHSSWILRKSGISKANAGKELDFNFGTPLTADFPLGVNAFEGVQMSHAYYPDETEPAGSACYPTGRPEFLIETWYNPPATQATSMPGWFETHFDIMRRYRNMASVGVLVGTTTAKGKIGWQLGGGPAIRFDPSTSDMNRLKEGMKRATTILWEAGATRVMPATYEWIEFPQGNIGSLSQLNHIRDGTDILLSTSHPQGGNAIGPAANGGVVDKCFRVHGFNNLHVCDASVFPPGGLHVQPQLTVMAMADYGATKILGPKAAVPRVPQLLPRVPPAPAHPAAPRLS